MMKTRLQTILIISITTLIVSGFLFTELVTSAIAGNHSAEQNIPNGPDAADETFTIDIGINPPPPYLDPVPAPRIRVDPSGKSYDDNATVSITDTVSLAPDFDSDYWQFKNWSGTYETATSPLLLTATQNYDVTANFSRQCYELTLEYTGMVAGDVGTKPAVTASSTFCDPGQFAAGEAISLQAVGIEDYHLIGWSGTLDNTSAEYTNEAKMPIGNHTITAHYELVCHKLVTSIAPSNTGSISRSPDPNPNCPTGNPGNWYRTGTNVTLEALPALGYGFSSWSGDIDPIDNKENPLGVLIDSNHTIAANFELACHTLILQHTGEGTDPDALPVKSPQCEAAGQYVAEHEIALSAEAGPNWQVANWVGADNPDSTSETNTLTFPKLPAGAEYFVTVNYVEQPTLQFSSGKYLVPENVDEAKILVKRTGSLAETVTVKYASKKGSAKPGLDYDETSGTLTFVPGDEEETIVVKITNDNIKEDDENLFLTLSNPTNALLGTLVEAEIVIQDNEGEPTLQFSTDFYEVAEFASPATITVTLFPASTDLVYVELDTMPISATGGEDYEEQTAVPITFVPGGPTSKQVQVILWDDTLDETDETVQLKLSNSINAPIGGSEGILTIIDDDPPPTVQFSQSQYYAKEGDPTAPITITLSAASALSVTLDFEVIELTVGRLFADTVTFGPGEEIKAVDIPVGSYQVGDELNIVLNTAENATLAPPSSAVLTILDSNRSDCHLLTLQHNGYGSAPLTTNIDRSQGCALGYFVADELIDVLGQPDLGWIVDGWHGTLNDSGLNHENVVKMPNSNHTVTIYYITYAYLPTILQDFASYFEGPQEEEPNNALIVSQANGPLRSKQQYFGSFPTAGDQFDIYYIYLADKGNVQVELTGIPSGRDYNLYLYAANADLKGYSGSLDNKDEYISSSNLQPGIYFVAINFADGAPSTAQYKVTATFE